MIAFNYQEVHRDKLFSELVSAGIDLQPTSAMYCYLLNEDGKLWIDTTEENRSIVEEILLNHNPIETQLNIEDKLAIAGLSVDDLKSALGL